MDYNILPFGNIWHNGIFNVPVEIIDKYLRLASEYQLKALLYLLRNCGKASSNDIAKALGQTAGDIDDLMEFWIAEGVITTHNTSTQAPSVTITENNTSTPKPTKEILTAPRLTPKDVVAMLRDNQELSFLLNQAQQILGRTISHAEQEMLINMVNYYGLKAEIIMMILEFYRNEKQKGKSIGISYINTMAKNWADEGISTITQAEDKLIAIEKSDRLWNEIISITGIRHKQPTEKQREMITAWFDSFDITMITLASDIMKESISEPKLTYINSILKKWKAAGISTPSQVKAQQAEMDKAKATKKNTDKIKSKATYDLDKIKQDAMNNTDI